MTVSGNGELTDDCKWEWRVNRLLGVGTVR